jgi:molecular chaperone IbpA
VRKVDDKHYTIEIAVAGFAEHEIDIEIDGGKLVVKGNTASTEPEDNFIFKGIANRAFTRAWAVGDEYEVKDAEMFNGILKIALERLVPVTPKAKKVPVKKGSGKQYLTEEDTL